MNVIGWLILAGGLIYLAFIAAMWLLAALGVVLKGAADTAEVGATSVLDLLGKKRLMRLYEAPEDLLDLEVKLATEDLEKYQLLRYAPSVYEHGPLEDVKYIEELPKLFKREEAASTDTFFMPATCLSAPMKQAE